jgi:ubiquinol-cytochrome c reductase iron-sulfur subunit
VGRIFIHLFLPVLILFFVGTRFLRFSHQPIVISTHTHTTASSQFRRSFAGSSHLVPDAEVKGVPALDELGSVDSGYYDDRIDKVNEPERRAFAYLMLTTVRFAYASAARLLVVKLVASLSISASAAALATADFDLSAVEFGETITVKWRGKPIFIRRRKPEEVEEVRAVPMNHLRDQEMDEDRVLNPEWIIVLAICPHLGCVPVSNAGEYNGWFCPCHGSHYDISGRIRKGPAPLNLEVPPYQFMDEPTCHNLLIG